MSEGRRFGAGDGILKDMGLSSSSPGLQRVRREGDGLERTDAAGTVYGKGHLVMWHANGRVETGVGTSSFAPKADQTRRLVKRRVGIRDLEETRPRRDGVGGGGSGGWSCELALVDPRDPGNGLK